MVEILTLIVGIILIIKFGKSIVKIVAFAILLLVILTGIGLYFGYTDYMDIQKNFNTQPKLFLLQEKDRALAGLRIVSFEDPETIETLTVEDLEIMSTHLANRDYEAILGHNYKAFIFKLQPLIKEQSINFQGQTLEQENIREILYSETTPTDMKTRIFAGLFSKKMEEEGQLYLIKGVKSKDIRVYPETPLFKIAKYTPNSLLNKVVGIVE